MILIIGCGFLGDYLLRHVLSHSDEAVLATVRNSDKIIKFPGAEYIECDITNREDICRLAERCKNEELTVFYFAASHNIDYVYENPEKAAEVNIKGLNNFISSMPQIKKLFFSSTDCVYGDSSRLFSENDALNPVNEYGRQKICAENIVRSHGYTVLRFPFMIDPSLSKKKHFYNIISDKLSSGNEIDMIDGMKRSVISYKQAAQIIYTLSQSDKKLPEIINVCSDELLSKYEMGLRIACKIGYNSDNIKKISEDEGKKFFKDKRASCTAMDNSLLKTLLGIEKLTWEE